MYSYSYDGEGRLTRSVLPTGRVISLQYSLGVEGASVLVTQDGKEKTVATLHGSVYTYTKGKNNKFIKTEV